MKSTNKDMADSLRFWGVPKIYRLGAAVAAVKWDGISEKKKAKIERKTSKIAAKLRKNVGKVKPGLKTKGLFFVMRMLQKSGFNPADVDYWRAKGWLDKARPWKR